MANSVVKFYRGPQASYNSTTHVDGIYFATDTKKIIMNGTEYGGDSNKKVSNVALNANANGIVITYTDSTSTTLLLGKATVTADGLMSKKDKAKLDSCLDGSYIINSLESDRTDAALSAAQGKALKTLVAELKTSVAAALDYKGTKDTYEELPTEGNKKGDVWNVVAAHGTTPAGTNYAWDGAAWDPLGGTINLSGYYTKSQVDGAISAAKTELEAADTALEGQITTVTNQLANKVDKVEGSGLISDTDLNQIRTNKADIANLQTSVGGKQEALTAGDAVEISEANVIDVKIDPVSDNILAKSESGLRVNRATVAGNNIKVGVAITGGAEIGADQTVAEGMKALSDSIKTAVAGSITSITSPDNTIKVTGKGTSRGLAVDMSKLVSTSSSIQVGTDGKLDIFWSEVE